MADCIMCEKDTFGDSNKMGNCSVMLKEDIPVSSLITEKAHELEVTKQQGNAIASNASASYCLLCLNEAPDMLDRSLFCKATTTPDGCSCCLECLQGYISSVVTSACKGTVPALPSLPASQGEGGRKSLLAGLFFSHDAGRSDPRLPPTLATL